MKNNFKKKFNYWLDKEMSKGTISIIRLLSFAVFSIVVFVSLLIFLFKLRTSFFSAFWDSLATIINAWMPSSEDGEVGYIILNTITAVVGLLFTSILIGVVSSGIEERLDDLRKGNSNVLENGHTVILGYNSGEHGLLKQLILAAGRQKRCIVIFTDIEKPEMEQDIKNNIEVPKNITVLCRNGDITNINDLRCCSIETADLVIINAMNDNRRIKAILACSVLMKEFKDCHARIVACVSNDKYLLPRKKILNKNITMLKTDDIMAKIIAHTATEPGLSFAFKELMNFEQNEFYFENEKKLVGKSILEASRYIDHAVLAGIKCKSQITLNPDRNIIIHEDDELILFEESKGKYSIHEHDAKNVSDRQAPKIEKEPKGRVAIFGNNALLDVVLKELPCDVEDICIFSDEENVDSLIEKYPDRDIINDTADYANRLESLAGNYKHIIILADRMIDKEDADISSILLLLKLMDIRERRGYDYNLVVELNMEGTHNVAPRKSYVDYIVTSNIASLILAQIAENPELEEVFNELLTNRGNELYSKPIRNFNLHDGHDYSVAGLKEIVLSYGYTLLGIVKGNEILMNPDLIKRIQFSMDDRLIVLGKE